MSEKNYVMSRRYFFAGLITEEEFEASLLIKQVLYALLDDISTIVFLREK